MNYLFPIFFSAFFLVNNFCFAKTICDCSKYQTGNFYIPDPSGKSSQNVYITRTKTQQTESIGDDSFTFRVIWINECKYVLRDLYLITKKKYVRSDVVVKIIETGEDYYIAEAWAGRFGKKMRLHVFVHND